MLLVETSVNVISNSPSQDYTHPDDRTLLYDMTPGFKPFTRKLLANKGTEFWIFDNCPLFRGGSLNRCFNQSIKLNQLLGNT